MGTHRLWENSDCEQTAAEQTALSLLSSRRQRVSTRAQLHPDSCYPCLDALPSHAAIKGAIIKRINVIYLCFMLEQNCFIFCFPSNNGPYQERVKNKHTYTPSLEPCQLKGWASASSSTGDQLDEAGQLRVPCHGLKFTIQIDYFLTDVKFPHEAEHHAIV